MAGCAIPCALLLAAALSQAPAARAGDAARGLAALDAQHRAQVELGRRLFFDPAASPSRRRSCASCHDPNYGYSDPKRLSADDFGITTRHSQTILDSANNPSAHWDGEFASVAGLVTKRVGSARSPWQRAPTAPPEMPELLTEPRELLPKGRWGPLADGTRPNNDIQLTQVRVTRELVRFLDFRPGAGRATPSSASSRVPSDIEKAGHYAEAFGAAFGGKTVTLDRIARAIEAYCKTVKSTEAPIDRHLRGVKGALSEAAKRGLALFRGRAGCAACHTMEGERPAFTDYAFRNNGVAWSGVYRRYGKEQVELLGRVLEDPRLAKRLYYKERATKYLVDLGPVRVLADGGRGPKAGVETLDRFFKTPTLRDVARRPPYMHDGSMKTLEAVVGYYAKGCCAEDPAQDGRLKGFEADERDVADLVAFLGSLSGDERPGLASSAWTLRAPRTRVLVTDRCGRPLGRTRVALEPAGDVLPARGERSAARTQVTSDEGWIEFAPGAWTHTRISFDGDGEPAGGTFIPDTCRETTVELPISGRMTFVVKFPAPCEVPMALTFRHRARAGGELPATRFARTSFRRGPKDTQEATYEGWVRDDQPKQVVLDMPGLIDPLRGGKPPGISIILDQGPMVLDLTSYAFADEAAPGR